MVLRGHADGQTEKRIRPISNYFLIIQIKYLHKCGHKIFREIVSGRHLNVSGLEYFKCPDAPFETVCIRLSASHNLISSIKSLLDFSQDSIFTRKKRAFMTSDNRIQQVTSKSESF